MQRFAINNISFVMQTCPTCNVLFLITDDHDNRLRASGKDFYCPNGHCQSYGNSTEEKLKKAIKERDEAKKIIAMRLEKAAILESSLAKAKRQIKRLKAVK